MTESTISIPISAGMRYVMTISLLQRDIEQIERSLKAVRRKNSKVTDRQFLAELEPFTRDLHDKVERAIALYDEAMAEVS